MCQKEAFCNNLVGIGKENKNIEAELINELSEHAKGLKVKKLRTSEPQPNYLVLGILDREKKFQFES